MLEGPWRENRSPFYKGMIIYASGFVHAQRGNPRGVYKAAAQGGAISSTYRPYYMGVDVDRILAHAARCLGRWSRADRAARGRALSAAIPFDGLSWMPGGAGAMSPSSRTARDDRCGEEGAMDGHGRHAPARSVDPGPGHRPGVSWTAPWCWRRWPACATSPFACSARSRAPLSSARSLSAPRRWSTATRRALRCSRSIREGAAGEHPDLRQHPGGRAPSPPRAVEEAGADIVDFNMGCPVPKVIKAEAGAALMRKPEKAQAILKAMVDAVSHPCDGQDAHGLGRRVHQRGRPGQAV